MARKVYVFKGFHKFLSRNRVLTDDPFEQMEFNRLHKPLPQFLSVDEMNTLLMRIRQPIPALLSIPNEDSFLTIRDRAMLETLYSAALRVSELCGMNWQDIDLAKRKVRVLGKGNKERQCPLGQYALDALIEYAPHYEQRWEKKPEGPAPVWLSEWERRINTRSIPRTIRKWCHRAGVKRVNPSRLPAQRSNTHVGERRRYTRCPGTTWSCAPCNDGDLYPRGVTQAQKRSREHAPAGLAGRDPQ